MRSQIAACHARGEKRRLLKVRTSHLQRPASFPPLNLFGVDPVWSGWANAGCRKAAWDWDRWCARRTSGSEEQLESEGCVSRGPVPQESTHSAPPGGRGLPGLPWSNPPPSAGFIRPGPAARARGQSKLSEWLQPRGNARPCLTRLLVPTLPPAGRPGGGRISRTCAIRSALRHKFPIDRGMALRSQIAGGSSCWPAI